jgi:predicted nucleic acid-binding protein
MKIFINKMFIAKNILLFRINNKNNIKRNRSVELINVVGVIKTFVHVNKIYVMPKTNWGSGYHAIHPVVMVVVWEI